MSPGGTWWGTPGCYPVADGVHRIPLSMPNDGLRAVNVYALEGPDGLVLVDGGWAVESAHAELEAALATIGRSPADVRDVLVTHVHRDHYTFAVALRRRHGTRVRLGQGEAPGLRAVRELGSNVPVSSLRELRRSGASALGGRIETMTRHEPFAVHDWEDPDEWLAPGTLTAGGRRLEVVETPGHTKGHVVLHDTEAAIVFTGDHVLPTITPSIGFELGEWDLPLARFLSSLELLLERPDGQLLPAHGYPGESVHARVVALLAHHEARFGEILDVLDRAPGRRTAAEVAAALRWTRRGTPFAELDDFNAMIAICETIAHLDVLALRHRVTRAAEDGMDLFGSARP